ncbi:MAG TPA: RNA methyltransferase [Burkholderiales bacterium]|nr:RNA methyltransferase [Burkholderiales bacterium]
MRGCEAGARDGHCRGAGRKTFAREAFRLIRSKDNPQVKRWAKLAKESSLRRAEGRALVEGPHLLEALLLAGLGTKAILVSEDALSNPEISALLRKAGGEPAVLSPAAFRAIADAETPQGIAAEIEIPKPRLVKGDCVFLEGIQDPGNVGAILRSAAALGLASAVLDRACADPWSPKVLRAAMGGHFRLSVQQVPALDAGVEAYAGKLVCTVVRDGQPLRKADLSGPIGWIFGSEGAGVSAELAARAAVRVTIPMAAGAESLNVAAAAAVCFYEKASRPGGRS